MSENSKIEWTDHTFNPWEGCQKVGPGCDNCYAETRNARFAGGQAVNWGPGAPRRLTSPANWRKPLVWNAGAEQFLATHGRRQRVFCASLADVFDNAVDPQWRDDLFALIRSTPNLDWLLLTKRIGNVRAMVSIIPGWMPDNVWLGATICNQAEADRDLPKLLALPARVRFLSMEPLLGPVNLHPWLCAYGSQARPEQKYGPWCKPARMIDWVIAGGESGRDARAMHPDWPRELRDQCVGGGVPFLFKQWGEWKPIGQMEESEHNGLYRSRVKARPHEDQGVFDDVFGRDSTVDTGVVHLDGTLHDALKPMAFSQGTGAMLTFKVGKKASGRLLDGVQHDEFPEVVHGR